MGARGHAAKRLFVAVNAAVTISASSPISYAFTKWAQNWWVNRSSIMLLTAVNTFLTTGTEIAARTLVHPLTKESEHYGFFVTAKNGVTSVNRQSLINIWMTFFASILGGPVYFFRRRHFRYMFFLGFGVFNSYTSQMLSSLIRDGIVFVAPQRLFFDLIYSGTLKFFMFELARRPILLMRRSFSKVSAIRATQDFSTTLIRVGLLNFLGFKG